MKFETHNEDSTLAKKRSEFWQTRYKQELDSLLSSGIYYNSTTYTTIAPVGTVRLARG
jgi:hypothetical protein